MSPERSHARNLILVGPMGAGKTHIAGELALRYGLRQVDIDREIEARAGASVAQLFEREGEAGFRARERAMLEETLAGDGLVVATGGGAVIDPDNRHLLHARGFVVHLHVSVEDQLRRLANDRSRPLLARGDREQVLRELAALREPMYRQAAHLRFDTGLYPACDVTARLVQALETHWAPTHDAVRDAALTGHPSS